MEIRTVAILSPGDMGHAIGAVLHRHGLRVITSLRGRSARTQALAKTAGMQDVPDDETLVREADILLSIMDVRVVGVQSGQASGLKMCYASVTKGLTALATEALTAGRALGLQDTLINELQDLPAFRSIKRSVPGMPPKAYRWVGEMQEIARTFADLGLPSQMLEGAVALYQFVESTELGLETPEQRQRGQTLEEVTEILANALQKQRKPEQDN